MEAEGEDGREDGRLAREGRGAMADEGRDSGEEGLRTVLDRLAAGELRILPVIIEPRDPEAVARMRGYD